MNERVVATLRLEDELEEAEHDEQADDEDDQDGPAEDFQHGSDVARIVRARLYGCQSGAATRGLSGGKVVAPALALT
jgi:hypothetical protein